MVISPGPSLPPLIVSDTSGCAASTESTRRSIRALPSCSLPTPKLMFITSGIRRCRGEADGVVHRAEHGAGGRDTALRAERDLEAEELRARRHPVEALHAVEIVRRRRCPPRGCRGRRDRRTGRGWARWPCRRSWRRSRAPAYGRAGPSRTLPGLQVVVHRTLAGQRAVAVGIGQQHPAVGGARHDDRQGVADGLVAVEVRRGRAAERQLGHDAAEPGAVARHGAGASESRQPLPRHMHGVAVRA